jgi:hypothetical protein
MRAVLIVVGILLFVGGLLGVCAIDSPSIKTPGERLLFYTLFYCTEIIAGTVLFAAGCIVSALTSRKPKARCPMCCDGTAKEEETCPHCGTVHCRPKPPATQS